ncbi:DUF5677 domain-containing protein [Candidatus Manganitrophus noduliformans]|uniref:DUF5677 domain-containing protein n=1 Tax=Candidatus Manganitrophus noduliformans TaxID=2606439 RepID=UPI003BEF2C94
MIDRNQLTEQCQDTLSSVLGLAMHFLGCLRFDRRNPQQLYSVCLYSRLLELASGCSVLLEKNTLVGLPLLLRSMFEANIDLANLMKSTDYPERMHATFLEQKLKLIKETLTDNPNPPQGILQLHRGYHVWIVHIRICKTRGKGNRSVC